MNDLDLFHRLGVVDEGMSTSGEPVAIKKELASDKVTRPTLEYEYHVYQTLAGHESIPNVKTYYRRGRFNYLVMDLLGPSLGDRFQRCNKRFSLRTTVRLALGMVSSFYSYVYSNLRRPPTAHCYRVYSFSWLHSP